MGAHVFQYSCNEVRRDLLRVLGSLWLRLVYVYVTGHQQIIYAGPPSDVRNNALYGQGVVGDDVAPHETPPLPSCCQTEADNVRAVDAELLKGEVLRLAVEDDDSAAIRDWRLLLLT